jgi:hypothetical protein
MKTWNNFKSYLALIILLFTISIPCIVLAQKSQCGCANNKSINESVTKCDTITLKNGSKLYYQFNCEKVWLTLENKRHRRKVIYLMSGEEYKQLYGYHYRIGYSFAKEYNKYLLFRNGCSANGPCNFVLIDKYTGKKIKEFGELIYNHKTGSFHPFIMHFNGRDEVSALILEYVDTHKKYEIAVNPSYFSGYCPEYMIDEVIVNKGVLILKFNVETGGKNTTRQLVIDLKKYHS